MITQIRSRAKNEFLLPHRVSLLAERADAGQLTGEEEREYDRFIELGDIISTLRLKAERQMQVARGGGERRAARAGS